MYIIIVGCGKIGVSLAKALQNDHNVVIVDKDKNAFAKLGRSFNGISLEGDGLDSDILKEAGIEKSDALAATTSYDNTNIAIAQIAKKIFKVQKVSARVSDPTKAEIYRKLGVDTINSTLLIAALLRDKIIEKSFSTYILESNKLTIVEINSDSLYAGKKVKDLNIPGEFQIITVVRGEEPIIPEENLVIKNDDILVGLAKISSLKRIRKTIKLI